MRKPGVARLFSSAVYHRGMEPPGSHVLLPLGVHPVTPCTAHTLIPRTSAMFDWDKHASLQNKGGSYLSFCLRVECSFTTDNSGHTLLLWQGYTNLISHFILYRDINITMI